MTYPAKVNVPQFLRDERHELHALYDILRDPLVTQVYGLLLIHSSFETGEFLGGYDRLIELCTPPQPERGRRRKGPTRWQIRAAVQTLVDHQAMRFDANGEPTNFTAPLVRRGETNAAQGQLRLWIEPRKKDDTPERIAHRVNRRLQKSEKLDSTRLPESPMDESPQAKPQGFQGVNTLNPLPLLKPATYPQPKPAKAKIAAAKALLRELKSSPPTGGKNKAPPGGRVDAKDVPY